MVDDRCWGIDGCVAEGHGALVASECGSGGLDIAVGAGNYDVEGALILSGVGSLPCQYRRAVECTLEEGGRGRGGCAGAGVFVRDSSLGADEEGDALVV